MKCNICEKEKKLNKDGICMKCQRYVNSAMEMMDDMVLFILGVSVMVSSMRILQGKEINIESSTPESDTRGASQDGEA